MTKKRAFTLIEILLSVSIIAIFIGIIVSIYTAIRRSDSNMFHKRIIIRQANDFADTIHELSTDYTIDYEEYFNRSVYSGGFSHYGNTGSLYYCSNSTSSQSKYDTYTVDNTVGGCVPPNYKKPQKYLQYYFQHRNTVDGKLNHSGNVFLGKGPRAISPNTGLDALYLISNDGTHRIYFRQYCYLDPYEKKCDIQMLQLVGLDAGRDHNFKSWGAYDGFIDTWACDQGHGFICNGDLVSGPNNYSGYRLPADDDDGWVSLTDKKITISDFKVDLFPSKDPYLATNETGYLQDPYMKLSFTMIIHGRISRDKITLSITQGFKNPYYKFKMVDYTGYILP